VPVGPPERFRKREADVGLELVELVELKEFEMIELVAVEDCVTMAWVEETLSEDHLF
jgi:hypothetical protein